MKKIELKEDAADRSNETEVSEPLPMAQPMPLASDVTAVGDSLHRLVRPSLSVATVHEILTKFIAMGEGDSPAFVEIAGKEVPLEWVSQRMAEKHVKFGGHTQSR